MADASWWLFSGWLVPLSSLPDLAHLNPVEGYSAGRKRKGAKLGAKVVPDGKTHLSSFYSWVEKQGDKLKWLRLS